MHTDIGRLIMPTLLSKATRHFSGIRGWSIHSTFWTASKTTGLASCLGASSLILSLCLTQSRVRCFLNNGPRTQSSRKIWSRKPKMLKGHKSQPNLPTFSTLFVFHECCVAKYDEYNYLFEIVANNTLFEPKFWFRDCQIFDLWSLFWISDIWFFLGWNLWYLIFLGVKSLILDHVPPPPH